MAKLTREDIVRLLNTNPAAIERAVVVIYDRQTRDEKGSQTTKHLNRVGFTAAHASKGSYYARWVLSKRHLTGVHLDRARQMMLHYVSQLLDEAALKQSRTQRRMFDEPGQREANEP